MLRRLRRRAVIPEVEKRYPNFLSYKLQVLCKNVHIEQFLGWERGTPHQVFLIPFFSDSVFFASSETTQHRLGLLT